MPGRERSRTRDPKTCPGQQHRGRGAGDPASDDDDVVLVHAGSSPVSGAVPVGCGRQRSARQVVHDGVRVVAGAVDEAGVPAVLEPLADHVDARARRSPRGTGGCAPSAPLIGRSHPGVVGAVAGRQDDRPDPFGAQVEPRPERLQPGRARDGPAASTSRVRPARSTYRSMASRKACMRRRHADVRSASPSPNVAMLPCRPWSRPVSRTPRRCSAARSTSLSTVSAPARPDELEGGLAAGCVRVGHLVDRACEPAGGLEPPEDVHAAVAAGHPGVPADREDDVPARPGELVGDLHA